MKKLFSLLFLALQFHAFASDSTTTIIQALQNEEISGGKVKIYQDARIEALIGKRKETTTVHNNFTVGKGFRVQIFSGNNQNTSKKEAFERDATVKRDFVELETYITFKSPFWRLRVGNFHSYEEAYETMRKIKDAYPQYGKETYVVKDEIKIYH